MAGPLLISLLLGAAAPSSGADVVWSVLADLVAEDEARTLRGVERARAHPDERLVGPLVRLLESGSPRVKPAAATALGAVGVPSSSHTLGRIRVALTHALTQTTDAPTSAAAASALARYPFPDFRQPLLELAARGTLSQEQLAKSTLSAPVNRAEATARLQDYLALIEREAKGTAEASSPPELVAALRLASGVWTGVDLEALLSVPHPAVSLVLAFALRRAPAALRASVASGVSKRPLKEASLLLELALADSLGEVRLAAIRSISGLASVEIAQSVAGRLAHEPSSGVREAAKVLLLAHADAAVFEVLAGWPADALVENREIAVALWSHVDSSTTTVALVRALSWTDRAGDAALESLRARADEPQVSLLMAALEKSPPGSRLRERVLAGLAGRHDPRILPALLRLLAAGSADRPVLDALAREPELEVRAPILETLEGEDPDAREHALSLASLYRGSDVVKSLDVLAARGPLSAAAFELLGRQDPADAISLQVRLLGDPIQARWHGPLIALLRSVEDERIAPATVKAVQNSWLLYPLGVELIRAQPKEAASSALFELAKRPEASEAERAETVVALGQLEVDARVGRLLAFADDPSVDVKMAARNALHASDPKKYPEWDPYGRIPLVAAGAAFGASSLMLATEIANADLSLLFTGSVGLVLGGATPFLFTMDENIRLGDASYFATTGLWGSLGGYGLGLSLGLDETDVLWSTFLGQALGVTAGALTLRMPEWSVGDSMLANFTALEVGMLVGAIAHSSRPGDPRSTGLGLLGAAATTLPMTFLARRLVAEERLGTIITSAAYGAWLGPWMARAFSSNSDELAVGLGLLAGQSTGFLLGLGFAQLGELSAAQMGYAAFGSVAGAAIGGGLGLSFFSDEPRVGAGLVAAGTAIGAVSLGLLAEQLELEEVDFMALSVMSLLGAVAGGDFMVRSEEKRFDEAGFPGGLLLGAGLGLGAGLVLTQITDLSWDEIQLSLFGSLLFGSSAFGFSHLVSDVDVRARSRAIGIAAGSGLILGGLFAEDLDLSGDVQLYSYSLGGLGAAFGGLAALYADSNADRSERIGGGVLFGATSGLALGLGLAQFVNPTPRMTGAMIFGASAGSGLGAGLGLLLPQSAQSEVIGLLHGVGAAGLVAGPLLESVLHERDLPDRSLAAHVALPMLHGAWQGALLPWLHQTGRPPTRELAGGLLLGSSIGATFGLLSYHLLEQPLDAPDLVEASLFGGLGGTIGAGLGLLASDPQLGVAFATGLGLSSYLAAWLVAPLTTYSTGDVAMSALGAATGAWIAANAVGLAQSAPTETEIGGALLFGSALGMAGSMVLSQWVEPEPEDVFETALLTTAASAMGAGLALSFDTDAQWIRSLAMVSTSGVGLLAGALIAEHTRYDERSPLLISSASAIGAWQGAWLPLLWHGRPRGEVHAGGALLGAGAGALAGTILSQVAPREQDDQLEIGWSAALGNVFGGGTALLATDLDEVGTAALLTGMGLGGYALGYMLSPHTSYSAQDMKLMTLIGALGAWHGGWLPSAVNGGATSGEVHGGAAMLGLGVGLLGGQIVSQFTEVSNAALKLGSLSWFTLSVGAGGLSLFADAEIHTSSILMESLGLGGLALGLALGDVIKLDGGDPWLIALSSALGGMTGATLPVLTQHGLDDAARTRGYAGGTMLGASVGAAAGVVLTQLLDLEPEDVAKPTVASGAGAALGLGLGLMIPKSDARGRLALMDAGAVLGLGAGLFFAQGEGDDAGSLLNPGLGASIGALLGLATPALYNGSELSAVPGEQAGGGLLFGSALGLSAGFVLDEVLKPDASDRERVLAGALMGALSGSGLGLAFSTDDRLFVGLGQGLTLLGAAGAAFAPKDIEFSWSKAAAGTTYLGYLSWHSLGLTFLLDGTDRQAAGVALATMGLGSATGLYLLPNLEPQLPDLLTLFAGSMWGTWIGAWSGTMARRSTELGDRQGSGLVALSSALGSDLGLALTGLIVSKLVKVEPTRFAVINLAGLTGMVTGMITAGFLKDDPLLAGNVIGSVSGLALGALVTAFIDFSGTPAWDQILGEDGGAREEAARAPSGDGPFRIHSWYPGAQVLPSEEGAEQYVFSISGFWD